MAAPRGMRGDWPQFRGPARDGKSQETDLLRQWPPGGPKLVWAVEDLGIGFASIASEGGILYTTGLEDETGSLYAYSLDGKLAWKKPYGPEWAGGRDGTRTTPTIDDGLVYVMSSHGRVVCFDAKTGHEKWAVNTAEVFGARIIRWGIAESLLVDGENLICTPGGKNAVIVALNKKTGQTVWICSELDEKSAYCSPILIHRGKHRLILTLTANFLVALDADTGELLWKHGHKAAHNIHAVGPVYEDGRVYITSGYGGARGEMLELSPDGKTFAKKWSDKNLDCHHGGVIVHDGYIYGASDRNLGGNWVCLDHETGEVMAEIRAVGKGSVAYADGMLYSYGENGQVGLIHASPTDFRMVSSFKVTKGSGEHWAHPTIANGRLYIRHGNALMAYEIKATP